MTFWLVVADLLYCLCVRASNVLLAFGHEGGGRRFRLGHNTTEIVLLGSGHEADVSDLFVWSVCRLHVVVTVQYVRECVLTCFVFV